MDRDRECTEAPGTCLAGRVAGAPSTTKSTEPDFRELASGGTIVCAEPAIGFGAKLAPREHRTRAANA